MRILRSGRCRIALALLLTFAAWVASCWWMMPYRPRTTFRITDAGSAPDPEKEYPVDGREYRQLLDISPSGDTIYFNCWAYKARQHSTWNEYWDTKAGKRTEQNSAEELFRFGVCHREPSPYRWDTRLGVSYQQAVASYRYQVSLNLWECDGWRGYDHAFSDNGRFLASPVWAGPPPVPPAPVCPIGYAFTDLTSGKQIALLRGCDGIQKVAPDGRTAATIRNARDFEGTSTKASLVLWNLQNNSSQLPISENDGIESISFLFYSRDGEYLFARVQECAQKPKHGEAWIWWNGHGRQIATVYGGRQIANVYGKAQPAVALADSGHVFVTFDSEGEYSCKFWNVVTGKQLGEYRVPLESMNWISSVLISSRDGPYIALQCAPVKQTSFWEKWGLTSRIHRWLFGSPPDAFFLILDVRNQEEIGRIPSGQGIMSADGRVLVTADDRGTVAVYDLPLRKPWARIFGFAAIGTMATCGGMMGLRGLIRRRDRFTPIASSQSASESPAPVPSAQP